MSNDSDCKPSVANPPRVMAETSEAMRSKAEEISLNGPIVMLQDDDTGVVALAAEGTIKRWFAFGPTNPEELLFITGVLDELNQNQYRHLLSDSDLEAIHKAYGDVLKH